MGKFKKTQILGHGRVGKSYSPFSSFYFGKFSLLSLWLVFIGVLFIGYVFTFHLQSDFQKESYRLKYERSQLMDDRQLEQQRLSDLQSLEGVDVSEWMVDPEKIEYLW